MTEARSPDNFESNTHFNRWTDQDPALARALEQLRKAPDRYHAQVALNIIKVVLEHQIEQQFDETASGVSPFEENVDVVVQNLLQTASTRLDPQQRRRWYDANESLRSAMQLLKDSPDEIQQVIIPTIARMIEQTLNECFAE